MKKSFSNSKIIHLPNADKLQEQFSGGNQKKLFVVYSVNDQQEQLQDLLKKILAAVKFDIKEDVLLLTLETGKTISLSQIRKQFEISYSIIFGFLPKDLGLNFNYQKYTPFDHKDQKYLFVDSISDIAQDNKLKSALWSCMKEIFQIS